MPDRVEALSAGGLLAWFRRHERRLALAWLTGTAMLLLAFLLPPSRDRLLTLVQRGADRWEARWTDRLHTGQRLVAERRWAAANAYLTRLDREFPARNVRHGRDKQREEVLRLLAQAQEAEGRSSRTIQTWERLVAFDSLNYANHFGLAQAAERLLSGWAPAVEARDGYAAALRIFPSHLPSVRGYIEYYAARGEFQPVVDAWRDYLDAWLVQPVRITVGDTTIAVRVPVDGLPHDVDLAFPHPGTGLAELRLVTDGFAINLERVELEPAARVGVADLIVARPIDLTPLVAAGAHRVGAAWLPDSSNAALVLSLPAGTPPLARLRLRLTLFKPVDQALWARVRTSYRNLLDQPGLARAEARTVPFPDAASADNVIERLPWATEGLTVDTDE
jgi:tetratricopeptide (TPR) repeat protein